MTKRAIAVIGQGFVGGALSVGMCHAFDVYAYDKAGKVVESNGRGKIVNGQCSSQGVRTLTQFINYVENNEDVKQKNNFTGVYFVCVPTPMCKDGSADTSVVESVLKQLADIPGNRIAVIKSTCPPGSTQQWNEKFNKNGLHVIFNPEFLREVSAVDDFINQNRIVLGGPRPQVNDVKEIYNIAFPNVPVIKTSSSNAELIKYVTNTYLAMKVSYANELYDICNKLDSFGLNVDYDRVIEIATLDERLGKSHWKVPGPMPANDGSGKLYRGFSGSCFIKDLNALLYLCKTIDVDHMMLDATNKKNLLVRPQKDWEHLLGRAVVEEENKND
jgi:UDPglucose 6-dehydrogenase